MKKNHDPLMLWWAIEKTHKVHSISKVAAVVKRNARKEYTGIKQGPYESIIGIENTLMKHPRLTRTKRIQKLKKTLRWTSLMAWTMPGMQPFRFPS
jgi:hypothetical protein